MGVHTLKQSPIIFIMAEIKEYNPIVGIRLKDLQLLLAYAEEDPYENQVGLMLLECIINSIEDNTTYTFGSCLNQMIYDNILKTASETVKDYDKYLLSIGYTEDDIEEYHQKRYKEHENKKRGNDENKDL